MLVRDRNGLEVLMVERHGGMLFGPGALVFPGGKLDPQDRDPAWFAELGSEADEMRICAIRETFEETGMLLGRRKDGGQAVADNAALRSKVIAGELAFREAIALLGLQLDLEALTLFSRWITPISQPIRFDASFYIARAPSGQEAVCDGRETITAEWLAPCTALGLADAGRRKLMTPTRANLSVLAESPCVEHALESAKARVVQAVLQPG